MGYLSIITVPHDNHQKISRSNAFGKAIAIATRPGRRPASLMLRGVKVGDVLLTTHANDAAEYFVDALPSGVLAIAWVYHDAMNSIEDDHRFGEYFAEQMRALSEMSMERSHPIDTSTAQSSETAGYVFFNLAPGYRARVLVHGNLAEVTSYTVKG